MHTGAEERGTHVVIQLRECALGGCSTVGVRGMGGEQGMVVCVARAPVEAEPEEDGPDGNFDDDLAHRGWKDCLELPGKVTRNSKDVAHLSVKAGSWGSPLTNMSQNSPYLQGMQLACRRSSRGT